MKKPSELLPKLPQNRIDRIRSLSKFHEKSPCVFIADGARASCLYGDRLQVECPTGSGRMMNLQGGANEIGARLALASC